MMKKNTNTPAQEKAIKTIGKNLLVDAGAGTGKTKVLTERYLYILENGNLPSKKEVESIVAITFTRKATKEMKERIRKELRAKIQENSYWKHIYYSMDKANISTIHSFCSKILRENPISINVDPMFRVLDENEKNILLYRLTEQVVSKKIKEDRDLIKLFLSNREDNLESFIKDVKKVYETIASKGYKIKEVYNLTMKRIREIEVSDSIEEEIKEDFIYLMENTSSSSKFNKLAKTDEWDRFIKGDYSNRQKILRHLEKNIGTSKANTSIIESLKSKISLALLSEELKNTWTYESIFRILFELDAAYMKEKNKFGILDYNDLEFYTYELLKTDLQVRKKYQDKYRYIMIDEFQDTNIIQKKIFYLLASEKNKLDRENLFVVGDLKQAIYGFRGGDIDVFLQVSKDIEEINKEKNIFLNKNFRSIDKLIIFINNLFSKIMEDQYIPIGHHKIGNENLSIELIENNNLSKTVSDKDYEAYCIGRRIRELIDSNKYFYRDIALLFRSNTNVAIYEKYLNAFQIPYYNYESKNILNTQEVIDLINGLRLIVNIKDKISLLGFLRSPMIGLSDESIHFIVKYFDNFDVLLESDLLKDSEALKLREGINIIKELKSKKGILTVSELTELLIQRTFYKDILCLYDQTHQKLSNVNSFLNFIREYEDRETYGLHEFIKYIEDYKKKGLVVESMDISSGEDNLVSIMTIHKSKGLEFPVVIVPELSKAYYKDKSSLIFNKKMGLGFNYGDNSAYYNQLKEINEEEDYEEQKRILYVAFTRAEHLLILGNQGRKQGFKKLLENNYKFGDSVVVNYSYEELDYKNQVKDIGSIDMEFCQLNKNYTNLLEIDWYGSKNFNRINPSQYMDFKVCKRKFFYEYYKPLEEIPVKTQIEESIYKLDPRIKGNIVHKFCELYKEGLDHKKLLEKIVKDFQLKFTKDIEDELMVYVENYIDFHSKKSWDYILNEQEFYFKLKDNHINGIIDRVYIKDKKAYIYDFKTNELKDKKQLINYYKPQLQIYALAFSSIYDYEVESSNILFLKTGEVVEIDISDESLKEKKNNLESFIEFIKNNSKIEDYEQNINCNEFCKYKELCLK